MDESGLKVCVCVCVCVCACVNMRVWELKYGSVQNIPWIRISTQTLNNKNSISRHWCPSHTHRRRRTCYSHAWGRTFLFLHKDIIVNCVCVCVCVCVLALRWGYICPAGEIWLDNISKFSHLFVRVCVCYSGCVCVCVYLLTENHRNTFHNKPTAKTENNVNNWSVLWTQAAHISSSNISPTYS